MILLFFFCSLYDEILLSKIAQNKWRVENLSFFPSKIEDNKNNVRIKQQEMWNLLHMRILWHKANEMDVFCLDKFLF
jgi:hypothetical protein